MKFIYLVSLILATNTQLTLASGTDCTMTPAPIDIKRIARQPIVKSYTLNTNKLGLTALLKNGSAVKLLHAGCYDSGGIVTEWLDTNTPVSDTEKWIKEAIHLAETFLDPFVFNNIKQSLQSKQYKKDISDARMTIMGSSSGMFTYSIVFTPVEHGAILSISYNFSG